MKKEKLKKILTEHLRWLRGEGGKQADLRSADLRSANLSSANLSWADLRSADLHSADLRSADLRSANLRSANLRYADLRSANLSSADLSWADLSSADLSWADLGWADLEFDQFPSIRLLSSMPLGTLSDDTTLELMRRDAYAHPKPELFNDWANGGSCPYQNEERFWQFSEKKDLWESGDPTMRDSDLILAICKEKGWGIRGCLEVKGGPDKEG